MDHIHLSALWSRLGKLRGRDEVVCDAHVEQLVRQTVRVLGTFGSRLIANTAHGAAKFGLGGKTPSLFGPLAEAATRSIDGFLAAKAASSIDSFNAQAVANTAWAFATAGHDAESLFTALAATAASSIDSFNAQDVANTAWAFATACVSASPLYAALARRARDQLHTFQPLDLSMTAWAFATAREPADDLFEAIAVAAVQQKDAGYGDTAPRQADLCAWHNEDARDELL